MSPRPSIALVALAVLISLAAAGCAKHRGVLAPPITDPVVFADDFGADIQWQPFLNSRYTNVAIVDPTDVYEGSASLRIRVPGPNDPTGGLWHYAGGAFVTSRARDLSGYNALEFYAKANRPIALDVAGFGNNNRGTSIYTASWSAIPITMAWKRYVIPIPRASRLTYEDGLFFFSEGGENGDSAVVWFDNIRFTYDADIGVPRPRITTKALSPDVGSDVARTDTLGTRVVYTIGTTTETIDAMPGYFTWLSSNEAAVASGEGTLRVVGPGDATITAKLDTTTAAGTLTLHCNPALNVAAPTPTALAADVISLFSNAYTNLAGTQWSTDWDGAQVSDVQVAGNDVKRYTSFSWAAVIPSGSIDLDTPGMTRVHLDVWIPRGSDFKVKLVDFGPDGMFGGAGSDDSEHELVYNASTTPAITIGTWVSLDIPLSDFTGLHSRQHIAQIFLSTTNPNETTAYVDNVYFHK